jgi:hypothetical protein
MDEATAKCHLSGHYLLHAQAVIMRKAAAAMTALKKSRILCLFNNTFSMA